VGHWARVTLGGGGQWATGLDGPVSRCTAQFTVSYSFAFNPLY